MKRSLPFFSLCFFIFFTSLRAKAQTPPTINYLGTDYYVTYLETTAADGSKTATIYFSISPNASSTGDIKVIDITYNSQQTFTDYLNKACTVKKVYDGGKTVVGCVKTLAPVFCAMADVPTDGLAAIVCEAAWGQDLDLKAAATCLSGVMDAFVSSLGKTYQWEIMGTAAGIAENKLPEAIEHAFNLLCDQAEKNQQ